MDRAVTDKTEGKQFILFETFSKLVTAFEKGMDAAQLSKLERQLLLMVLRDRLQHEANSAQASRDIDRLVKKFLPGFGD